jgi:hypothetical protein
MWLRLALYADVGFVADSLVDYRRHDDMETNRFLGVDGLSHELAAKRRVLDRHPDRVPDGRALLARCFAHVVEEAWTRARAARAVDDSAGALAYFEFASWAHAEAVRDAGGEYSARLLERLVAEPPRAVATPEPPPAAFAEVAVAAEAAQLAEAAELEMLRRLREEIFASRSWRLTAPLRWLKARLDRAD